MQPCRTALGVYSRCKVPIVIVSVSVTDAAGRTAGIDAASMRCRQLSEQPAAALTLTLSCGSRSEQAPQRTSRSERQRTKSERRILNSMFLSRFSCECTKTQSNAQSAAPARRLRPRPSDGTNRNDSGADSTEWTEMDADHSWSQAPGATWAGAGPTVRAP